MECKNYETFSTGQSVRVYSSDFSSSYRAVIATNIDGYDIVYLDNFPDENNVDATRIQPIEIFEEIDLSLLDETPTVFKEYGNTLFMKKDIFSAERFYKRGLELLLRSFQTLSIGSSVFVIPNSNNSNDIRIGTVCDIENDTYNIIFDNDDEIFVVRNELIPICNDYNDVELQLLFYLNLSRCCMKKGQYGWTIRWSSLAFTLSYYMESLFKEEILLLHNEDIIQKRKIDSIFIRAKSFLASGKCDHNQRNIFPLQH
jgi:hypothetical protein